MSTCLRVEWRERARVWARDGTWRRLRSRLPMFSRSPMFSCSPRLAAAAAAGGLEGGTRVPPRAAATLCLAGRCLHPLFSCYRPLLCNGSVVGICRPEGAACCQRRSWHLLPRRGGRLLQARVMAPCARPSCKGACAPALAGVSKFKAQRFVIQHTPTKNRTVAPSFCDQLSHDLVDPYSYFNAKRRSCIHRTLRASVIRAPSIHVYRRNISVIRYQLSHL